MNGRRPLRITRSILDDTERRLTLIKGRHRWSFTYKAGAEDALIDAAIDLAADPDAPFTPIDAAVIAVILSRDMYEADELSNDFSTGNRCTHHRRINKRIQLGTND